MNGMRAVLLAAVALPGLGGCFMWEPHYRNVGAAPHDWVLPGPETEEKVFGPIPVDELKDFVREKESEGWEVIGCELASLPEDVMVDTTELDRPSRPGRAAIRQEYTLPDGRKSKVEAWRLSQDARLFDIPKTMDDRVDPPQKGSIPPYLSVGVQPHRQKYLIIFRRWL